MHLYLCVTGPMFWTQGWLEIRRQRRSKLFSSVQDSCFRGASPSSTTFKRRSPRFVVPVYRRWAVLLPLAPAHLQLQGTTKLSPHTRSSQHGLQFGLCFMRQSLPPDGSEVKVFLPWTCWDGRSKIPINLTFTTSFMGKDLWFVVAACG